jgi:hypothetical protein
VKEEEYDYPDSGYPLTDGDALSDTEEERPEYGEEEAKAAKIFPYDDPPEVPFRKTILFGPDDFPIRRKTLSQNELLFKAFHYK